MRSTRRQPPRTDNHHKLATQSALSGAFVRVQALRARLVPPGRAGTSGSDVPEEIAAQDATKQAYLDELLPKSPVTAWIVSFGTVGSGRDGYLVRVESTVRALVERGLGVTVLEIGG